MAKQNLPKIGDEYPKRPDTAKHEPNTMSVMAPIGEGHLSRTIDAGRLTTQQAINLRAMLRHLEDSGESTANGKPVTNKSQAVRWMLENWQLPE